jgi:hypothetical protein
MTHLGLILSAQVGVRTVRHGTGVSTARVQYGYGPCRVEPFPEKEAGHGRRP